jgi:hypothetical protein
MEVACVLLSALADGRVPLKKEFDFAISVQLAAIFVVSLKVWLVTNCWYNLLAIRFTFTSNLVFPLHFRLIIRSFCSV